MELNFSITGNASSILQYVVCLWKFSLFLTIFCIFAIQINVHSLNAFYNAIISMAFQLLFSAILCCKLSLLRNVLYEDTITFLERSNSTLSMVIPKVLFEHFANKTNEETFINAYTIYHHCL